MRVLYYSIAVLYCFYHIQILHAQDKNDDIIVLQQQLKKEKKQQNIARSEASNIIRELTQIQQKIKNYSSKSRMIEFDILKLREENTQLKLRQDQLLNIFNKNRDNFIKGLTVLKSLKNQYNSIISLLLYPGTPAQSAQAQNLIKDMMPKLLFSMNKHRQILRDITLTVNNISKKEKLLLIRQSEQKELQAILNRDLQKRQQYLSEQQDFIRKSQKNITKLTQKIENLTGLINKIRENEKKVNYQRPEEIAYISLRSFPDVPLLLSPVVGRVITNYGESLKANRTSRAIIIEAAANAQIIAPFDGRIVFAGDFKNLGNVIIIYHIGDYHSVIIGAAQYYVFVGQHVSTGEPIGRLYSDNPTIHYELRRKGQAINPLRWINDTNIQIAFKNKSK